MRRLMTAAAAMLAATPVMVAPVDPWILVSCAGRNWDVICWFVSTVGRVRAIFG